MNNTTSEELTISAEQRKNLEQQIIENKQKNLVNKYNFIQSLFLSYPTSKTVKARFEKAQKEYEKLNEYIAEAYNADVAKELNKEDITKEVNNIINEHQQQVRKKRLTNKESGIITDSK